MLRDLIRFIRITGTAKPAEQQFVTQQMEYLNKLSDGLMVFPYGAYANVPVDSLGMMFTIQGHPEDRAVIAWDARKRPDLSVGEVSIYHPPTDATLTWRENGDLDISTGNQGSADININCATANVNASAAVNITAPLTTVDGNLTVTGDTTLSSNVTSNGVDISDTHFHTGSPTAPAGPVSNTGVPV